MLIDLHAHTKGISRCCKAYGTEVLLAAKEAGLDGICLCNHYQDRYVEDGDALGFARRYNDEFRAVRVVGEELGVRVLYGIEVTMNSPLNHHMLVYGVDESFLLEHPNLYEVTQAELHKWVHEAGGVMVQAHPIRAGRNLLMDPAYLDGVEVNCHPKYDR